MDASIFAAHGFSDVQTDEAELEFAALEADEGTGSGEDCGTATATAPTFNEVPSQVNKWATLVLLFGRDASETLNYRMRMDPVQF